MSNPFCGWPIVAADSRPRAIFVLNIMPTKDELEKLESAGYIVVDIRSIDSRVDAVEAHLWGIHEGTIESDPKSFKYIELLARSLKMTSHLPTPKNDENPVDKRELDNILNTIKGASDETRKDSNKRRKVDPQDNAPERSSGPVQKDAPKLVKLGEPGNGDRDGDDLPPRAA